MNKIQVGQVLYFEPNFGIEERVVTKVGKKYVYFGEKFQWKIPLDTLRYTEDYKPVQFYTNKQDIIDIKEKRLILHKIKGALEYLISQEDLEKITLENLRLFLKFLSGDDVIILEKRHLNVLNKAVVHNDTKDTGLMNKNLLTKDKNSEHQR